MKIKAEDINGLLESATRYFESLTKIKPEFGVPYNLDTRTQKHPLYQYSGHIGITGSHKGGLVISCEKKLVEDLVRIVLGSQNPSEEEIIPMLAEMANTIAGNARVHFGAGFDISVPSVFVGKLEEFKFLLAEPTLVIPLSWKNSAANLIVGIA